MAAAALTPEPDPGILALHARPGCDADTLTFVRLVAGLVANGHALEWVLAAGASPAALRDEGPAEVARTLAALEALGVAPRALDPGQAVARLAAGWRLLRLAPRGRGAAPALLRLDPTWLAAAARAPERAVAELLGAGQVIGPGG